MRKPAKKCRAPGAGLELARKEKSWAVEEDLETLNREENENNSRVPDQNGVSLLYIIVEIHHSGRKPSEWRQQKQLCLRNRLKIRWPEKLENKDLSVRTSQARSYHTRNYENKVEMELNTHRENQQKMRARRCIGTRKEREESSSRRRLGDAQPRRNEDSRDNLVCGTAWRSDGQRNSRIEICVLEPSSSPSHKKWPQ